MQEAAKLGKNGYQHASRQKANSDGIKSSKLMHLSLRDSLRDRRRAGRQYIT
jgi:hypothetical protein